MPSRPDDRAPLTDYLARCKHTPVCDTHRTEGSAPGCTCGLDDARRIAEKVVA